MFKPRLIGCLTVGLLLSFGASGCATREPMGAEFCLVARMIFIEPEDVLTDSTARQILYHNELGARLCDWPGMDD